MAARPRRQDPPRRIDSAKCESALIRFVCGAYESGKFAIETRRVLVERRLLSLNLAAL